MLIIKFPDTWRMVTTNIIAKAKNLGLTQRQLYWFTYPTQEVLKISN